MMKYALARRYWRLAVVLPTVFARPAANILTVSGSPANMIITTAVAGQPPTVITDATTTYTITTGAGGGRGVTGQLNTALPAGVSLTVTLAACGGGTSYGPIVLTATAQNLVHGVTATSGCTATITYQLSATVAAGVVALQSKTVTLKDAALP